MKQEELDARALVGVVRARAGAGDTDGAVAAGLTAAGAYARIDQPDDVTAVQVLAGDVLQGAGRFDEAEAQYRAALAPPFTFAGRAGAHCGLAELALRGGDLRAAGSRLVRALPYLMGYAYARFDEGTTAIALSLASIDAALGEPSAASMSTGCTPTTGSST
jgi:hypothetical protein